jgi:hypothetical protein
VARQLPDVVKLHHLFAALAPPQGTGHFRKVLSEQGQSALCVHEKRKKGEGITRASAVIVFVVVVVVIGVSDARKQQKQQHAENAHT